MKNLLLIALILLSGLSVFAQETTIDKAEFDKAMAGNFRALRNQPYRTIEQGENQTIGTVLKSKIVREQVGGNSRMIYESDSAISYIKTETVYFNGKRFTRKLNNPWVEEKIENKPPPSSNFETILNETTYYSLGEQKLDGKTFKVYRTKNKRNMVHKEQGSEHFNTESTTYYFTDTGLLVKSESLLEMTIKPKNEAGSDMIRKETKSIFKRVVITELDPNIKIEAPQVG